VVIEEQSEFNQSLYIIFYKNVVLLMSTRKHDMWGCHCT